MKKVLFFLASIFTCCTSLYADSYKILFINTPSIVIDKKVLHVGDVFDEESDITWSAQKQAMKVQNLKTKQIRLFTSSQFSKSKSVKDFFLKQNRLSTRGGELLDEEELKKALCGYFYLLDSIDFCTVLMVDEMAFFSIVVDGKEVVLPEEDGKIIIKRELFPSGKNIYKVSVFYTDKTNDSRTLITNDMSIEVLPMKIQ